MDLPSEKRGCHRTGFTKKCRKLVLGGLCERWVQIQGKNPNTGEDINRSQCIDDWTFLLSMEHSQQQRQTGAAVESARNEAVKSAAAQVEATKENTQAQARATEVFVQSARAMLSVAAQTAQIADRIDAVRPNQITHKNGQ